LNKPINSCVVAVSDLHDVLEMSALSHECMLEVFYTTGQ